MKRKFTFPFLVSMLAIISFTSSVVFGQGSVSYSPPSYYLQGSAITNLAPAQSNVTVNGNTFAEVSTFAGTGTAGGDNSSTATSATFNKPSGIVKDALGNYYIAEDAGKRIRKISSSGVVSTIYQFSNFEPRDITINTSNGDLYVVIQSHRILRIPNSNAANYPAQNPSHSFTNDATNVFAGSSSSGYVNATGTNARFSDPWGITMSADNTYLLVADYGNGRIRKVIVATGVVSDFISTTFSGPTDILVINNNLAYVAEYSADRVKKIENGTTVSDFVSGSFHGGRFDGTGSSGFIDQPFHMTADALGNLYVVDNFNHKVRKVTPAGLVSTVAGSLWNSSVFGFQDGNGVLARYDNPRGILFDEAGGFLLVTDSDNHRIRKVQLEGFEILPSPSNGLNFNSATGVLSGTPTAPTLASHYIQTFNSSSLGTVNSQNVTLANDAAVHGDILYLTPRSNSNRGGLEIPASGVNSNLLQVEFDLITTTTDGADGVSYSFAPDASAAGNSPSDEIGSGTKLSISFMTFSGSVEGIRVLYNPTAHTYNSTSINSNLLAFVAPSSIYNWIGKKVKVKISVDADAKLTLVIDGYTIVNALQLPSDYITSNKSTWKHVFKARTGAVSDIQAIDNLSILQGYGTTTHKVIAREYNLYQEVSLPILVYTAPSLSARTITAETHNSATANYTISALGNASVTAAGIVWGTTSGPTVSSNAGTAAASSMNAGNYATDLSALSGNTTYYVRAYVTTNFGYTAYSNELTFKTLVTPPSISYSPSTNTYTVGTSISPLAVTNTGGAIPTATEAQVSTFYSSGISDVRGICFDAQGNMYFTGYYTHRVYKLTPSGSLTTIAGSGTAATVNGTGTSSSFNYPTGIVIDASNNLYVGEYYWIRKITPAGVVTTFAAIPNARVHGLEFDSYGNLFATTLSINGSGGHCIYKVTSAGVASVFAGSTSGVSGLVNGTGTAARFNNLVGMAIDDSDNIFVLDNYYLIRKITPAAVVTTFAGSQSPGNLDGTGTAAKFLSPWDMAIDDYDNLYVPDGGRIRKITPQAVVTTIAGQSTSGTNVNGNASVATFSSTIIACAMNPDGHLFVYQQYAGLFRKITTPVVGSFSVNPSLPAGLTLSSTGTISGTPTVFSPATNYTVTGTNASGSATATVNITVEEPIDHTLNLTASQADEITETSAVIVGDFIGANSTVLSTAPYTMVPYGSSSNIGHIYQMTLTGTATGGTVWGSGNLYTHDSHIARAAVHAGILADGVSGTVFVKLLGSENSYPGTTANGVTTAPWGYWPYSYEFVAGIPTTNVPNTMTVKGIVYAPAATSTSPTLTTAGAQTVNATNTLIDDYSLTLTGLTPGTNYIARAYATNDGGTYYSTPVSFTTPNITYSNYTKTLGDAPFYVSNQYSPSTSTVVYSSSNTSIATVSGNTITIVGAGTATITASQASQGTSGYYGLIENTFTVTVAKGTPTLSMSFPSTTPLNTFTNGSTLNITVSSNSNGTLGLTSSMGTIGGSNGAFNLGDVSQTGSITLTTSVAESDNYLAATLSQTLNVEKANQIITFPTPQAVTYSPGATIDLSSFASSSSLLPITYTLGTNSASQFGASLSGNILTILNSAPVTIIASQAGNTTYNPAVSVSRELVINKGTPTLAIDNVSVQYGYSVANVEPGYFSMPLNAATAPPIYNGPEYTTNSDGLVNFEVQNTSNGTLAAYNNGNGEWEIPNVGTYNIVMQQASGTNYNSGTATSTLTVTKADQSIYALPMNDISVIDFVTNGITLFDGWNYYGNNLNGGLLVSPIPHPYIVASYGPGQLQPEFTVESQNAGGTPSASLIVGTFGTFLDYNPNGDGTVKLTITQPGDQNHNAVTTPVVRTFNVVKSNQTLTVDDVNDAPVSSIGQSFVFNYSTNANYGLSWGLTYPLVVTSSNPNVISWNATTNEFTYVGAGTATITVSQAGNAYYNSALHTQTVTVSNSIPLATVTNTTQNFCAGATLQSLDAQTNVNGATLVWYAQATGGSALDYTTTLTNNTTYYVAQELNGSESSRTAVAVVFYQDLSGVTVSTISGLSTATPGTPLVLSVTPINGATSYIWDLPAGLTIASSSNNGATVSITVANGYATGIVKVKAVNSCGETPWQTKTVYAPGQTGMSITGTAVVCGGTNGVSYSVPTVSGASYQWSLPVGLTYASGFTGTESSIQVNFASGYVGGYISCVRSTSSTSTSASISVGAMTTPGAITQSTALCGATSTTYSIAAVSGATSYQWQLPTGMTGTSTTNSITATFSGSVSGSVQVRAVGTCGTSAWRSLAVASTPTPSTITGPSMLCGAATYTITGSTMTQVSQTTLNYSVTNVAGTTYAWAVPSSGMTITSGQGTNAIVVSVDLSTFTSGSVSVIATVNGCQSAARTLTVSKSVATITGPAGVCGLTTATYSVPAGSGSSYTWTLPSWMTPSTGYTLTSNPIQVDIAATGTSAQPLSVEIATSCGNVTVSSTVGCGLYTQLENAYCGASVDASQTVLATWIQGATSYRFTISGAGLSTPVVVTNSYRGFGWTQVPGYQLGTTYTVTVALAFNNSTTFGNPGSSCTVTPTAPTVTTSLETAFCGQSVAANQTVLATWVQGATSYRFTISGAGLSTPVVVTNSYRGFGWTQVPGYQLGTTYTVTVALAFGGSTTFGNEGASCTVTPTAPTVTTSLETAFCDQSVAANQTVLATWVQGATSYRFTISGAGLSTPVVVTNNYRGFGWTQVPGYQLGTSYTVTVAIAFGGSTTFGNPGASCTVTPTAPTVTTSLETAFCGQSVDASQTVLATWIQGATSYRFTISGAGLSTPVVVTNNYRGFGWTQVPGYQLGTSYTVTVAIAFGGSTTFGNPGSSCTVTPTAPTVTTSLESAFCGQSVAANQSVLATWIQGATSYRFTISGTGLANDVVVTNSWRGFSWASVPGYQLGSTYAVKVALAFGGSTTFGNDGTPCNVTLIAPQLTTQSCTTQTYPSGGSSVITANTINGATGYRFRFTNSSNENDDVYSTTNSIDMSLEGVADGSYTVTVAVAFGGTGLPSNMTYGTAGPGCTISFTNPAPLAQQEPQLHEEQTEGIQTEEQTVNTNTVNETAANINETNATTTWTATATSNPFAHSFQIKLNGAEGIENAASFTAQLTDMSGKVYSQATLTKEQLEAESFGEQLAPGMYLMTLRQGEELRVIRVVKR